MFSFEIWSSLEKKIPAPVSREKLKLLKSTSAETAEKAKQTAMNKYSKNFENLQTLKKHLARTMHPDLYRDADAKMRLRDSFSDRFDECQLLRRDLNNPEKKKELYVACCETLRYYEKEIARAEDAAEQIIREEEKRLDALDKENMDPFWEEFWNAFYPAWSREMKLDVSRGSMPEDNLDALPLWICHKELPRTGADIKRLQTSFDRFFWEDGEKLLCYIPVMANTHTGFTAFVEHDKSGRDSLVNTLITGLLKRLLCYQKPVENRVIFLDGRTKNAGNWEVVNDLNEEHGFVWFPNERDWNAALTKLEKLNPLNQAASNDPRWLIVYGYPNDFSGAEKSRIDFLVENSAACAVNVLLCSEGTVAFHNQSRHSTQHSIAIQSEKMTADGQPAVPLTPPFRPDLDALKETYSLVYQPRSKKFLERIEISEEPPKRLTPTERFSIRMPFAIDKNTGELFSMEMDNHSPFAYIAARTQSGKTSVIHMIIFSLMMSRHPDDLELWLIDLKGTEYERYREDAPPHIRYILSGGLSEGAGGQTNQSASIRLAEEVVEKIREEVARRVKLCKQYGVTSARALKEEAAIYLPAVLIVLDEYSVIADIPGVQDSLNLLLKQAAAYGVYGIFCNQEFKVSGLGKDGNNIPIRMGMMGMTPKKVPQLYQKPKMAETVITDGGEELPKFHSVYECPGGAYYLEHLFFQSETDLDELKRRLKKRFETYECLPRAQRKTDSAKGAWLVSDRADQYYDKEPVFRGVGESYPFEEYEELLKSLSKGGALFFGLPLSFKRTRALRFGTGSKQHALLIADARSLNAPTLVQETVRALFITAKYNWMQAEIWAMEDDPIRAAFPSAIGGKALSERLARLKEEIADRQPRLIIVSDVYRLFEEAASAMPSAPSTYGTNGFPLKSRSASSGAAADPLAQSAPQKASVPPIQEMCELLRLAADRNCHFFIHANNLHELSSASALCPDYNLQKRLSTDGFEHIICAAQDEKSEAALEFVMGKKLRGLESNVLLYTETTTGKAYVMNPFDFGLRARVDLTPSEDD